MNSHTFTHTRGQRGFTMVEILTVVAILMILMTIGVIASQKIGNTGNAQLTRATLAICNQILTETQVARGKTPVVFNPKDFSDGKKMQFTTARGNTPQGDKIDDTSDALEINDGTEYAAHSMQRFVASTFAVLTSKENKATDPITRIYGSLDSSVFVQGPATIVDVFVHENKVHTEDFAKSEEYFFLSVVDGWGNRIAYKNDTNDLLTTAQNYPHDNFLPKRDSPFFASAGPDGEFGNVNASPKGNSNQQRLYEASQDNLYSYDVINP